MLRLLMIADDFTGALDTGVQLAAHGIPTQVVVGQADLSACSSTVLVVDTETRHLSAAKAAEAVARLTRSAVENGVGCIYKKTDSALRGNIGAELAALLKASGARNLPFLPAFPQIGRTTKKGVHYIDGVPVNESPFGIDPFEPVRCAEVTKLIHLQTDSLQGKTVVISGSGNVAIYACEKATQMGAKVVTMSDSNGYVYDPNGIDLAYVKDLKEVRRGRIKEYAETHAGVTYVADCSKVWTVPCDIALPCATQNEINKESAEALVKGGCTVVCEGANMPSTPEAIEVYLSNGILYGPAKASNAGGVATSGLEMSQNSERLSWSFEEVDAKLKGIMEGIFHASYDASVAAGSEGNLMVGANCAGFLKVATAMMAQGITY